MALLPIYLHSIWCLHINFYAWLRRWAGECLELGKLALQIGSSGSKVPSEEQTVRRQLQRALENPVPGGWIGNLTVSVQNIECKIKLAMWYLGPGELPTRTNDPVPLNRVTRQALLFSFVWGPWTCKEQSAFHEVLSSPGVANDCAPPQGWPKSFVHWYLWRGSAVCGRLTFCLATHFSL